MTNMRNNPTELRLRRQEGPISRVKRVRRKIKKRKRESSMRIKTMSSWT